MTEFVMLDDAAARITSMGIPISRRGVRNWAERYPDLSVRIGGRRVLHGDALAMILRGTPLREVAQQMRAIKGPAEVGLRDRI